MAKAYIEPAGTSFNPMNPALFITSDVLTTLALVVLFILGRWLLLRMIYRSDKLPKEIKLKWATAVKGSLMLLFIFGVMIIWAPQIRTFALSLTAVAVAFVVATKELILCLSGSFLRASSSSFSGGDLIEVSGYCGYVVDQNLFSTTLQEIDHDTLAANGRRVVVPNSVFLANPVRNLSVHRPYVMHTFSMVFGPVPDLLPEFEATIAGFLEEIWADIQGRPDFQQVLRAARSESTDFAPAYRLTTTDTGNYRFVITLPCRVRTSQAMEIELYRKLAKIKSTEATAKKP